MIALCWADGYDLHNLTNIRLGCCGRLSEREREADLALIDLIEQRLDDLLSACWTDQWQAARATMPGGQQQITEIANMIIMVVGQKDGAQLVWSEASTEQLCGHAAASIKQEVLVIAGQEYRRALTLWQWIGTSGSK
jgi:hypothetical protein